MGDSLNVVIDEERRAHEVVAALATVLDPELGIDIVSLGLVYRVAVDVDAVDIVYTLTVPGCPMHARIGREVRESIERIPWVRDVDVHLTFEPPWTAERLSESAKRALGR